MKASTLLLVQLLWISTCFNTLQAQVETPKSSADTSNVLPADTVLPGQEEPFTKGQRLEGINSQFLKRAVIPSAVLITAGVLTMEGRGILSSEDVFDYRNKAFPDFSTEADDFAMLAPLVGLYGFNLIVPHNRHELGRQTLLLIGSGVLASALIWPTKKLTNIDRPNKEPYAFPSGHTGYAFAIATFVDKEFRHKSPWISVASYSIAGATGVLRILNNAHWLSDVLAGAGVGILSVNTVYWLHAKLAKDKGYNTAMFPVVLPTGDLAMGLQITF